MGSLTAQGWKSAKEKNFKIYSKKNLNYSQFDDDFDEIENYPQLNRYKKQDHRAFKRKDLKGDFDRA